MFSKVYCNLRRLGGLRDLVIYCARYLARRKASGARSLVGLLLTTLVTSATVAQEKPAQQPLKGINAAIADMVRDRQQTSPAKKSITITDAVSIFLQQNQQLIAARYDVDTADAEKLTARLRPNPQLSPSNSRASDGSESTLRTPMQMSRGPSFRQPSGR
jgi:hypothetical protein